MKKFLSALGNNLEVISLYIGAAFIFLVIGFAFAGQLLLGFAIAFSTGFGWLAILMIAIALEKQIDLKVRKERNRYMD